MSKIIIKLNTTGSLFKDNINNQIVSYRTPIYQEFKLNNRVLKVFNDTYYSATTRKHQSKIWDYKQCSDLVLHYCPYRYWSLETGLENEIYMTEYELEKLNNKTHKLGKRQAEQKESLTDRLQELQKLYKEI